ncbi:DUF2345 domain-containing protein, partial [Paraburkholderia sp. J94]|uniref:DUF2345 domain-containing protein n=1 Tax=Paraburkholderia sp. J94 TaxID=2805441 RepID=UPI002AB21C2F
ITTGRDASVCTGRSFHVASLHSISMFAYQQGMKFIANGRVDIQSQKDQIAMQALGDITVSSSNGKLILTADQEVWIGAGGSYIQINGGGITNGSPGPILEKGATWGKLGPVSASIASAIAGGADSGICLECLLHAVESGASSLERA